MAKDCSFDVVSEIDMQTLDNAVNNVSKEVASRFDLKDSGSTIELDKVSGKITLIAKSDMHADQITQVLFNKMVKLGLDMKAVKSKGREKIGGDKLKETFDSISGIDQDFAKKMVKDIKDMKLKVQASIQGEKLRVSGKSRDDLQSVISFIEGKNYEVPLQFVNYR